MRHRKRRLSCPGLGLGGRPHGTEGGQGDGPQKAEQEVKRFEVANSAYFTILFKAGTALLQYEGRVTHVTHKQVRYKSFGRDLALYSVYLRILSLPLSLSLPLPLPLSPSILPSHPPCSNRDTGRKHTLLYWGLTLSVKSQSFWQQHSL